MTIDDRPLAGKRVLVTRARAQAGPLIEQLEAMGATVDHLPVIRFVPPPSWDSLDKVLDHPDRWNWLVFTSTNGVAFFCDRMNAKHVAISSLAGTKIAAVGRATAAALEAHGLQSDIVPDRFSSSELLPLLPDNQRGVSTAIVRAREGRDDLIEALREKGGNVHLSVAYQTEGIDELPDGTRKDLVTGGYDALTFTSPSTVESLLRHLTSAEFEALASSVLFVSIGPTTSEAIRGRGVERLIEASSSTLDELCQAVVEGLQER